MALNYFKTENAIRIHDKIIQISGGKEGVKNFGNIDSPLTHIQNDDYYPTFEDKIVGSANFSDKSKIKPTAIKV